MLTTTCNLQPGFVYIRRQNSFIFIAFQTLYLRSSLVSYHCHSRLSHNEAIIFSHLLGPFKTIWGLPVPFWLPSTISHWWRDAERRLVSLSTRCGEGKGAKPDKVNLYHVLCRKNKEFCFVEATYAPTGPRTSPERLTAGLIHVAREVTCCGIWCRQTFFTYTTRSFHAGDIVDTTQDHGFTPYLTEGALEVALPP